MAQHPYVLLSCAMSLDGYIDDSSDERLLLSNEEDFDRVDTVRASCDAILVGAATVRRDNPRLLVRDRHLRDERVARGLPESPAKVTLTGSGDLDRAARFFTEGTAAKLVYCSSRSFAACDQQLGDLATVVDAGDPVDLEKVLADLDARGVRRLMVEGGGSVHTQFLTADLADELHLVIAPFFVGDPDAPRFVGPGSFPRLALAEVRRIGDAVFARYLRSGSAEVNLG